MTLTQTTRPNLDSRLKSVQNVVHFESFKQELGSERAAAARLNQPRTTLKRAAVLSAQLDALPSLPSFFQTEEGMAFLHKLSVCIEFIISQVAGAGIRVIQEFYRLLDIDHVVACSLGAVRERVEKLEREIDTFGIQQEQKLSQMAKPRSISLCLDETYPDGICLVAIEPVSNFIVLETQAQRQDAACWSQHLKPRLDQFQLTVDQTIGDEGTGLKSCATQDLGAHHSPDLFHIQQDIGKAFNKELGRHRCTAQEQLAKAQGQLQQIQHSKNLFEAQDQKPQGRPPNFDSAMLQQQEIVQACEGLLKEAQDRQESVCEAREAFSDAYHPFDIETGKRQTEGMLKKRCHALFSQFDSAAAQIQLSDRKQKKLDKAHRMVPKMVATLAFFWSMTWTMLRPLQLSPALRNVWKEQVLAIEYLKLQIPKTKTAEKKSKLQQTISNLQQQLKLASAWQVTSREKQDELIAIARTAAQRFQRSSSNVEGRNGVLSQRNHQSRQIHPRKLRASTVIHNFHRQRPCGKTPAELLFGTAHGNLFEHLLQRIDLPPKPRKRTESMMALKEISL